MSIMFRFELIIIFTNTAICVSSLLVKISGVFGYSLGMFC